MRRLILHAPNVHVGGGSVLLRELLAAQGLGDLWANLDARARSHLQLPVGSKCYFVNPTVFDRLKAEIRLRNIAKHEDIVLCFHGMPPLFSVRGRVVVFEQNRHHLGGSSLSNFALRTRSRLVLERFICRTFKRHVHEYIVQTPSMEAALKGWHRNNPNVRVIPFLDNEVETSSNKFSNESFDFLYVADGEPHKNHRNLLAAWTLLADEGIFPRLGLTLPERSKSLWHELAPCIEARKLRVENLGLLKHDTVLRLYRSAKALVFPSTAESLGLPLLEAARAGLPIIASERDYVRDVCSPAETFDPESPVSIARAIKRFLGMPTNTLRLRSASEFIAELRT